jgi:predicted nucleic acid-binding protein
MPVSTPRVYWDSCVFIDYIERTAALIATLDSIVAAAQRSELIIVTSVLSISEVSFAASERAAGFVDPSSFAAVDAMWSDRSIVTLVEVDAVVAIAAREIIRRGMNESRTLKPPDAIHLATARQYSCSDFHTTDEKLQRWNGEWFPVRDPFVSSPVLPPGP